MKLVAVSRKKLLAVLGVALLWLCAPAAGSGAAADGVPAGQAKAVSKPAIVTVTPRGAYARAVVEARLGRHRQALELLAQLPGLIPPDLIDDLAWRKAESLQALGRIKEAVAQLKLCLKTAPQGHWAEACRRKLKELGAAGPEGGS